MKTKHWAHNELQHDLAEHLSNPKTMVWEDMQSGPMHSARPDIYTMKKSYTQPTPTTYEIKVSASDFRGDVTSGKWQKYLNFSTAVIFAVPQGLIKREDLPKGCGLIVRNESTWRTLRKPTRQALNTIPQDTLLKLVIDGVQRVKRPQPKEWNFYLSVQKIRKQLGDDVANYISNCTRARDKLAQIESEVDQIISKAKSDANNTRRIADRELEKVRHLVTEASIEMGLGPCKNTWEVRDRVNELVKIASDSEVVSQCLRTMQSSRENIDRCLSIFERLQEPQAKKAA